MHSPITPIPPHHTNLCSPYHTVSFQINAGYSLLFNHIYPHQARSVDKYIDYDYHDDGDEGGSGNDVADTFSAPITAPIVVPVTATTSTPTTMPASTAAVITKTNNAGTLPTTIVTTTVTNPIMMFTVAAKNITKGSQIFMW